MNRDEFIVSNLPLVHSIANRFRGKGIDYEELYSAGTVGLVKACDNFDESRGLCFSTYAVPVIMGEIRRLFRDGGSVKVSRSLKSLGLKAVKAREELLQRNDGREPAISEIAEEIGASPEETAEALSAAQPTLSLTSDEDEQLDIPVEEGGVIDKLALCQSLQTLSEEDRLLIVLRYFRNKTQSETAILLKCSQVQVSRRERKILAQLREQLI